MGWGQQVGTLFRQIAGRLASGGGSFDGSGIGMQTSSGPVGTKISPWLSGVPHFPRRTFQNVITEGYLKNPLIAAGLRSIISVFAQAALRIQNEATKEEVPGHDLVKLIRRPDGLTKSYEYWLWDQTLTDVYTTGNCFWELVRSRTGRPVQILRLSPERVAIVPDSKTWIKCYLYEVDGIWWKIRSEDMLHWKFFHPLDPYFGLSPILAALRQVHTHNEATDYLQVTLQNLAVPPAYLSVSSGTKPLDDKDVKAAVKMWKDTHGKEHRGEIAVLQDMEIKTIAMSLNDMAFPELTAGLETQILMTMGGAALVYMVGAKAGMDRSTFANFAEARESLTTDIVQPLWSRFDDLITQWLLPNWDESGQLEAVFDTSDVEAMLSRKLRLIAGASVGFDSGHLTMNGARRLYGEPELYPDVLKRATTADFVEVDAQGNIKEPEPPPELPAPPADANNPGGPAEEDFGQGG